MQEEFIRCWGEYNKLNDELDSYRGKVMTEENTLDINRIIRSLQEKFIDMAPIFMFVIENYSLCNKAVANYKKFIDDIKNAGAIEESKDIQA